DSWGYNPAFYFATDKAYGTPDDYKDFIDACHANGIAVIMDMVLNHSYGQSPLVRMYMNGDKAAADNPWYNVTSPNTDYSWGYDFNHESKSTQAFVDSVCSYWMKEYKIDGFRFDFTKGFTNKAGNGWSYDASRINILKRIADEIWERKSDAIVILEHLTDNSEEKVLSDYGLYLWGNMNGNFNQATMGWENNNINDASYINRGWTKPNLVAYMESHDEERIMFKNRQWGNSNNPPYDVKDLNTGLKRTEAAAVLLMAIPGSKMIWQFGEMGYDFSINSRSDGHWEDTDTYRNGTYRLVSKPIRWDYLDVSSRKSLHDVYAKMIKLRNQNPIFSTNDYSIKEDDLYKQILLKSSTGNICAVANLNVTATAKSVTFGKTGEWEDYFTGEILTLTTTNQIIELQPGEYRLYISK
ncbi:MAG: alpha-amylase family glycosyl hydrolase, partial [Dysgonomonas sp.]